MHRLLFVSAALILFCSAACAADPVPPPGVLFEADVVYGKGGDVDLHLDLARPEKSSGPAPCVVVIHGGGWKGGDKRSHIPHIFELAQRGYVAATVQYRFAPKHRFPAQVEDVKCAVRFLKAHAEKYGIDPKRIGAMGVSAGGHLSMMLGVLNKFDGLEGEGGWADQSSRVRCVVSFVGPTSLDAPDIPQIVKGLLRDLLGGSAEEKPEEYKRASPLTHVDLGDPPMLLFAGTVDPLVPHTQATAMADAMTKAGVNGRVELLLGQGHGFGGDEMKHAIARSYEFLDKHLKQAKEGF